MDLGAERVMVLLTVVAAFEVHVTFEEYSGRL